MFKRIPLSTGVLISALMLTPTVLFAEPSPVQLVTDFPKMATIHYQLTAEQWVSTSTANVIVNVDASVNQTGPDIIQQQMNQGLQTIAKGDWQIVDMQRSQDSSGLESVHMQAQARLPVAAIANIRTQAYALSKPGIKYTIADTQYQPTLADTQAARMALRQKLYQQIETELKTVNQVYGDERFQLAQVTFGDGNVYTSQEPGPMMRGNAQMMTAMAVNSEAPAPSPTINQKITMTADVRLAAPLATK